MTIEVRLPVHRIDGDDYRRDAEVVLQHGISLHRKENGGRIGEAGGLNNHTFEPGDLTPLIPVQEVFEGADEIVPHRATDTSMAE